MTKQQLIHAVPFLLSWLIVLFLLIFPSVMANAQANSDPVSPPAPTPLSCTSGYQGGYIELSPAGNTIAETYITFTIPFCSPNYVITANIVKDINTNGEPLAVKIYTPGVASVILELDEASNNVYKAHWLAVFIEQEQ
jgi:hypothetical protein